MARRGARTPTKLRIFVVDDESTVRRGLELLLADEPGYKVCGGSKQAAALAHMAGLHPDLAVVDFSVYNERGLALVREIRRRLPRIKVLVFSLHDELPLAQAAFQAGALGYATKDEGTESLVEALRVVSAGQTYLAPGIAAKLAGAYPGLRRAAGT